MVQAVLKNKVKELMHSHATLLWLEGSRHEQVSKVQFFVRDRMVLSLSNGASRLIAFKRYVFTSVGIQFWSLEGRPGVLYRWDFSSSDSQKPFVPQESVAGE